MADTSSVPSSDVAAVVAWLRSATSEGAVCVRGPDSSKMYASFSYLRYRNMGRDRGWPAGTGLSQSEFDRALIAACGLRAGITYTLSDGGAADSVAIPTSELTGFGLMEWLLREHCMERPCSCVSCQSHEPEHTLSNYNPHDEQVTRSATSYAPLCRVCKSSRSTCSATALTLRVMAVGCHFCAVRSGRSSLPECTDQAHCEGDPLDVGGGGGESACFNVSMGAQQGVQRVWLCCSWLWLRGCVAVWPT